MSESTQSCSCDRGSESVPRPSVCTFEPRFSSHHTHRNQTLLPLLFLALFSIDSGIKRAATHLMRRSPPDPVRFPSDQSFAYGNNRRITTKGTEHSVDRQSGERMSLTHKHSHIAASHRNETCNRCSHSLIRQPDHSFSQTDITFPSE